jgi:hypothetical protein
LTRREWAAQGLDSYVDGFFGQEDGTKAEVLECLLARAGHDPKVLMIGDAMGDLEAARSAGVGFFPICPGMEAESWEAFQTDILEPYLRGTLKTGDLEPPQPQFLERLPDLDVPPDLSSPRRRG